LERLVWKTEYSLQHPSIDVHHVQIFELFNQLCEATPGSLLQSEVLQRLVLLAMEHFDLEEKMMKRASYHPKMFDHHVMSHRLILQKLTGLENASLESTLAYFREWIVDHMVSEDKLLENFLKETHFSEYD
jgi:hemerythrin-like metal-binding protein